MSETVDQESTGSQQALCEEEKIPTSDSAVPPGGTTVPTSDCHSNPSINENIDKEKSSPGCDEKLLLNDSHKNGHEAASRVTFDASPDDIEAHSRGARSPSDPGSDICGSKSSTATRKETKWGWFVVVASWIIMIPIAGTLSSFGTIVGSLTSEFNATKLETGWIGSLAFSFTVGTCPVSTPLFTVFGARKVVLFGVLGGSVSILVTSFVPTLYLMFLTYSTMYGISANFVYNSVMTLTGQYFPSKHQAMATCLASAGISFGTLLVNPFSAFVVSKIGWRNTLRVLSGIILGVGLLCVLVLKPVKTPEQKVVTKLKHTKKEERVQVLELVLGSHRNLDKQTITESLQNCNESKISLAAHEIKKNVFDKRMYDCSVCTKPMFILWMLGTLFWSLSFLFPVIFIIDYMGSLGIEAKSAAWVMTAYGIAEFVGRILCAAFADRIRFSLAYVYGVSCTFMGVVTLLAPQASSLVIMFMYGVCIGLNSGVVNSLMFTTTMQLFGGQKGPHVWGYINVMLALGMVVGPITAGGIYDVTNSYKAAFFLGGGMFLISAITMSLIPTALRFFGPIESKAKGLRSKNPPIVVKKGLSKPRLSLRSAIVTRQLAQGQPKWKQEAMLDLEELDELQEVSQDGYKNGKD